MSLTRNEGIRAQILYTLRKVGAATEVTMDVESAYDRLIEFMDEQEDIPPKVWAFVLEAYSRVLAKDKEWPKREQSAS